LIARSLRSARADFELEAPQADAGVLERVHHAAQARAARNLDFHRNVGQRERRRDVPGGIARRAEQREYCDTGVGF
jgi:hypothetical protein